MNSKVMLMAAFAVCACANLEQEIVPESGEMVELSFRIPGHSQTKVSGTLVEDKVNDLQVFVFGQDGQLHAYGHSKSDEVTMTCSTGEKHIAALVNAPALDSVSDEATLKELVSSFSDNSTENFVMTGIEDMTIDKTGEVVIPVERLVSKVLLKSVTNDFSFVQHQSMDLEIKSIFLTNAATDRKYLSDSSPSGWYNKDISDMSQIIEQSGDMMYDSFEPVTIEYGTTYESGRYLYCYPNPLDDGMDPTYLVVEAVLDGAVYYYPVALPKMESNKCYSVSLTVCRPGSSTPDIPVEKQDASFSVEVKPWTYVSVSDKI